MAVSNLLQDRLWILPDLLALAVALGVSAGALAQDDISLEVKEAWSRLPQMYAHGAVTRYVDVDPRRNKESFCGVWSKLDGHLLAETRILGGRTDLTIRGPRYTFAIHDINGARNCVSIVPAGTPLPGDLGFALESGKLLATEPFSVWGVPCEEFFSRCSMVKVSRVSTDRLQIEYSISDDEIRKIEPEITSVSGVVQFDSTHDYRICEVSRKFVNIHDMAQEQKDRIDYDESRPGNFCIERSYSPDFEVGDRITVTSEEGTPQLSEFEPEFYGIVPMVASQRWWQRPMLWIALFAVGCFAAAAVLRRRGTLRDAPVS
jgi:hypothetical protein